MKLFFQKNLWCKNFFMLAVLLLASQVIHAQEQENPETKTEAAKPLMSISELSDKIEADDRWARSLEKDLKLSDELVELYNYLPTWQDSVSRRLEEYNQLDINTVSYQKLEGLRAELRKHQGKVTERREVVSERLDMLHNNLKRLGEVQNDWQKEELRYMDDLSMNALLMDRLGPLLSDLNEISREYELIQRQELDYFNSLNDIENTIGDKLDQLAERENSLKNVLFQESEPLWALDRTKHDTLSFVDRVVYGLGERKTLIAKYTEYHSQLFILHMSLILLLMLFLVVVRKKANVIFERPEYDGIGGFFNKPMVAAYVMSFLFVEVIYDTFPKAILEFVFITLVLPVAYLMDDVVNKAQKRVLVVFLFMFVFHLTLELLPLVTVEGRFILFAFEILVFLAMFFINRHIRDLQMAGLVPQVLRLFVTIFCLTSLAAVIFNCIGSVQLSRLLLSGTIFSSGIGITLLLWNNMMKAFVVLIFELPVMSTLQVVVRQRRKLEERVFILVGVFLFWLFLVGSAQQFNFREALIKGWTNVIGKAYTFGELQVSIQDFINFFIVLAITVALARFLKYFFGNEILNKLKLERGVPNAISTSIYYFILVIGFFLAAASTGIQWSKVNLALGAIGVGIGFGLQNVIYNFISGLILIYERPIQVGDTIEFGNMMGPVTEIGIRSSKVLTYEGAEVIVPNGDLIAKEVINWTYTNQLKRRELIIKTTYSADPQSVIDNIKSLLAEIENVLKDPPPMVIFRGYGEGTLDFRVLFWTHLDVGLSTSSTAALNIYEGLKKAGFELPLQKSTVVLEQGKVGKKKT